MRKIKNILPGKRIRIAAGGLLAIILLFLFIINGPGFNMLSFTAGMLRLRSKSTALVRKARSFDAETVLRKLRDGPKPSFVYRLDEHLGEAVFKSLPHRKDVSRESQDFAFEFNGDDPIRMEMAGRTMVPANGLLRLNVGKNDCIENADSLPMDVSDIAEILLRVRVQNTTQLRISFFNAHEPFRRLWEKGVPLQTVMVDTIPDGRFHTYRLRAADTLMLVGKLDYKGKLAKIAVFPTDKRRDKVEIDYIRFVEKMAKYGQRHFGRTYEVLGEEMRQAVYVNTPGTLQFTLDLPPGKTRLSFGTGIWGRDAPVTFKIELKDGKWREIFSRRMETADRWHENSVDLSPWGGRRVTLALKTQGDRRNVAFWSNPVVYVPPKKKFNVIILLEDALRADHLSCYGHRRATSPVKDAFAAKGVVFSNAFSQATQTRPSCASFMTSLYPSATGVWNFMETLSDRYLTLAEILRTRGYVTASFIQNSNAGTRGGLHQGFGYLYRGGAIGKRAARMYGDTLFDFIARHKDRNFFLYIHLIDPHGVYDPPKPFDAWYQQDGPGTTPVKRDDKYHDPAWVTTPTLEGRRLLYDGEIRYNDSELERFLRQLQDENLLNDTLIIFMADHGEFLGEHDLWEHHPPGYMQVIKVPLIMVWPRKISGARRIDCPVQLLDIMPTVLDLAGVPRNGLLLQGDSLVPLLEGNFWGDWRYRPCISEELGDTPHHPGRRPPRGSIIFNAWHILNSPAIRRARSRPLIFNYLEDPEEVTPRHDFFFNRTFRSSVRRILRILQRNNVRIWQTLTNGTDDIIETDPATQQQLRSLGYLQ